MIEIEKEKFKDLIPALLTADINTLFAMCVLEEKVNGRVYVDDYTTHGAFYIQHPYGMTFLYGESKKSEFYQQLKTHMLNLDHVRKKVEWLQVYPSTLYPKIDSLLVGHLVKKAPEEVYREPSPEESEQVLEYQRINFFFHRKNYENYKRTLLESELDITSTSKKVYEQLNGAVAPNCFWNSYSDFISNGIGFTLSRDNIPVSTAFAAYVTEQKLEIGIETAAAYRGFGYAAIVCSRLIDYCLEHGYEPIWSCNSGNIGSRRLAQKLGFVECKRIPYYRLPL